ncbi:PRKC apoptosis WT1 regulator protein [Eucyclogobius newberryi]|uniref:PRKC apoptosis WT1 regulator protein n=1 Tax=Eucyclogobius newberryi TaxID=166745 RepID=UPI003B5BB0A5
MATGGFKSSAATDFLEEWKAKREKMRAKMLGDIAAATGAPLAAADANAINNNPDRSSATGNCLETTSLPVTPPPPAPPTAPAPSSPSSPTSPAQGPNLKKGPAQAEAPSASSPGPSGSSASVACNDGSDSPSPGRKVKEKKSAGPSARKGKGQIEKRKLREKRRSTGVVSMPSNESLDELDDDYVGVKDRREEEELVQANTFQNEAMAVDPTTGHLMETPRPGTGCHKSSAGPGLEDEANGNDGRQKCHTRDGASAVASLEKKLEELERELVREQQENAQLLKAHEEKDDLIGKLKEEIDLLNRDLDDIEDENDQLKQENKTLLKVVGQLTR